jgi:hypothetical protein
VSALIPDCPKCGKAVENIEMEALDVFTMMENIETVAVPRAMWLVPCMHSISGYTASTVTGNVTELKP